MLLKVFVQTKQKMYMARPSTAANSFPSRTMNWNNSKLNSHQYHWRHFSNTKQLKECSSSGDELIRAASFSRLKLSRQLPDFFDFFPSWHQFVNSCFRLPNLSAFVQHCRSIFWAKFGKPTAVLISNKNRINRASYLKLKLMGLHHQWQHWSRK